jgi:hypothetical protein
VRAAVRVVLDALDRAGNAVLVALEVDDAVALLVTATLMTRGDATVVVAPAGRLFLATSGSWGLPLCSPGVLTLTTKRRPAEVGLALTAICRMIVLPPYSTTRAEEVDVVALGEGHVRLLPVRALAEVPAEALGLAAG